MSTFSVPVVRIGDVEKHPNADTLSITEAEGCPCIIRTGYLNPGDLAVYVPIESVVKEASPAGKAMPFLKFKKGSHRVKASKLRGIFSMGVLVNIQDLLPVTGSVGDEVTVSFERQDDKDVITAVEEFRLGDDVAARLGIEKYEEPEFPVGHPGYPLGRADQEKDPGLMPVYDMESYRKYKDVFHELEVVVTEKLHGTNARFIHDGTRLWVGSHRTWKKLDGESAWNKIARQLDLEAKLSRIPGTGVFGEIYGRVQDLTYGAGPDELKFAVFDMWNSRDRKFCDWDEVDYTAHSIGLPTVPVLYRGVMNAAAIEPLADGVTTAGGENIREGIVIKSVTEKWNRRTGRTIAKLVSEAYLLRPGGTERH